VSSGSAYEDTRWQSTLLLPILWILLYYYRLASPHIYRSGVVGRWKCFDPLVSCSTPGTWPRYFLNLLAWSLSLAVRVMSYMRISYLQCEPCVDRPWTRGLSIFVQVLLPHTYRHGAYATERTPRSVRHGVYAMFFSMSLVITAGFKHAYYLLLCPCR